MSWIVTEDRLIKRKEIAMLRFAKGADENSNVVVLTLRSGVEVNIARDTANKIWNEFRDAATKPKPAPRRPEVRS